MVTSTCANETPHRQHTRQIAVVFKITKNWGHVRELPFSHFNWWLSWKVRKSIDSACVVAFFSVRVSFALAVMFGRGK